MNIYEKIMNVRTVFLSLKIKKSGYNKFSKFYYHELNDFLAQATKMFNDIKLYSRFSIIPANSNEAEQAKMVVINIENPEEQEIYILPTADCFIGRKNDGTGGADPIQNLGGKITYLRRYMYFIILDLIEDDSVDGQQQNKPNKKTPKQYSTPKSTSQFSGLNETEAIKLAITKGMETIEKLLLRVENFPYRDEVIKNVCGIYEWKNWSNAKFKDNHEFSKLFSIVKQELQKEKDLAMAGV